MDFNLVLFTIGVMGLSLAFTYALYCKVRVLELRQDLFDIRDELWDKMVTMGTLDDPAHRDVRTELNAMIRMAGTLSIWTLAFVGASKVPVKVKAVSSNDEVQKLINATRERYIKRVTRYITKQTFSGRLLWSMMSVIPKKIRQEEAVSGVQAGLQPMPVLGTLPTFML